MGAEKQYNLFFLNDYFDNEMNAILPILQMYLEETPKELELIERSLLRNDAAAAKAGTHKIKTNISMLSIRDQSSFVDDMHQLPVSGKVQDAVLEQFDIFKANVLEALRQIRSDFFEREDNATGSVSTHDC